MTTHNYPSWITPYDLGSYPSGSNAAIPVRASNDTTEIILVDSNIPGDVITTVRDPVMDSCGNGVHALLLLNGISVLNDTTFTMTLRAVNADGITDQHFNLTLQASQGIVWNQNSSLPSWALGSQHQILLTASWVSKLEYILISGQLPRGVFLDSSGVIYGIAGSNLVASSLDASTWQVSSSASVTQADTVVPYNFSIRARDINNKNLFLDQEFVLYTVPPSILTTDDTLFTADTLTLTADASSNLPIIVLMPSNNIGLLSSNLYASNAVDLSSNSSILTSYEYVPPNIPPPSISLGEYTHGDNFIKLIKVWNPTGEIVQFRLEDPHNANYQFASFLAIDRFTGYLNGKLPNINYVNITYIVRVVISKLVNGVSIDQIQDFTITVNGKGTILYSFVDINGKPIAPSATYTYVISQGEISTLAVQAQAVQSPNTVLFYNLVSGELPPGLTLTNRGLIAGQVAWDAALGTYNFSVSAYDPSNRVSSLAPLNLQIQNFQVKVNKMIVGVEPIDKAYDGYYRAFMPLEQRLVWQDLVTDSLIFNESVVYRSGDKDFGRRLDCEFLAFPNLKESNLADFTTTVMSPNFNSKRFRLGRFHSVIMNDRRGNYVCDVVYVDIKDPSTNSQNQSPPSKLVNPNSNLDSYPVTLRNQLTQLQANPGQSTDSLLPQWMTTPQSDGLPLGFVYAAVLCYVAPGNGIKVLKKIAAAGYKLNQIDFHVDRIILRNVPAYSTPTTFDSNSTTFNVNGATTFDITTIADKYIYFNTDGANYDIIN